LTKQKIYEKMAAKKRNGKKRNNKNKVKKAVSGDATATVNTDGTVPPQDNQPLPPKQEKQKPDCRYLAQGKCNRGDSCQFVHTPQASADGARVKAVQDKLSPEEQDKAAAEAFELCVRNNVAASIAEASGPVTTAAGDDAGKQSAGTADATVKKENGDGDKKPAAVAKVVEEKEKVDDSKSKSAAVAADTTKVKKKKKPKKAPVKKSTLPPGLEASLSLLSPSQQTLAKSLCELPGSANQRHIFDHWAVDTSKVEEKRALMSKLESVDQTYPAGGLVGYLTNAVDLLDKSRRGVNPLEGWVPNVPKGEAFEVGSDAFLSTEKLGLKEAGKCGFVLVAGGLGERLGYGGIKIGLPTELATETMYIQFYIETILAFQSRYAEPGQKLPLCIMTSGDTNEKTVALLAAHNNFGMEADQITIVQQGKGVPALCDNDAHIALDEKNPYDIQMKPHGHGDIHALLHSHGVAKSWVEQGLKWTVFFQDTNGLAFHSLALSLGVSSKMGLLMNSIACPRKAKQAIGGIVELAKGSQQRTINVEYNQLDPLLRATSYPDGDINDESGFSPFPGNINQLVFGLEAYAKVLERTKGAMPEFVNPKYKDAEKSVFKKPTRLECMMQDFPTVLEGPEAEKVGFTSLSSELCFSPVKNATLDGIALQQKGTQAGVASTGEADQSGAVRKILRSIGCVVEDANPSVFSGISAVLGPDCILKPNFAACANEFKEKFPNPSAIKISDKSSLVVSGSGLVIESLDLDGALVIECEEGATGVIRNLKVANVGWTKVADESSEIEAIRMRGFHIEKTETETIIFKKDGSIEGNYSPDAPVDEPAIEDPAPDPEPEPEVSNILEDSDIVEEPVVEEPAAVVEEPAAVVEEPAAVVEEPAAVVEEPAAAALSEEEPPVIDTTAQKETRSIEVFEKEESELTTSTDKSKEIIVPSGDLTKPAESEATQPDTLCGGCTIL